MNRPLPRLSDWPAGTAPAGAVVFAHNERVIAAPPDHIWAWLVLAPQWPRWYLNARRVVLPGGASQLEPDLEFRWVTFGTPLRSRVVHFESGRRLGWTWWSPGAYGYHGWLLEPTPTGVRVVTEETQRGPKIVRWAVVLRPLLRLAHAYWLRQLATQAQRAPALGHPPQGG